MIARALALVCLWLLLGAGAPAPAATPDPVPGQDEEPGPAPRPAKPPRETYGPSLPSPAAAAPVATRAQKLDQLYARLAAAGDPEEAAGLIGAIDRLLLESGSDTGDLLMGHAIAAMGSADF